MQIVFTRPHTSLTHLMGPASIILFLFIIVVSRFWNFKSPDKIVLRGSFHARRRISLACDSKSTEIGCMGTPLRNTVR
ncbi:uncharacterized protein BDW47DRAFT_104453 [Aspergillus candidus]|uniref:Uncharacterized protein n=1 Tax=Aspergillus candidus TaxID=41067 RepID=A0A2I2FE15_ASPCN|nr:hypothetical protein BDW47DRAFT_104453 [Aspergillus candidus]PLB38873.1 hypothetical protein BDW47DRAFT_104453 [Aspergillus candidus]